MLHIVTWNVLHRIHAVNWKEAPLARFPDERVRVDAIRRRVAALRADVICLQEVSGDQLATLGDAFVHTYPRVPRRRHPGPPELADPSEHLVTIARGRKLEGHTFESDPGKGYLAVDVGALVVINTHVSFRGAAQLALLSRVARGFGKPVAIVGDFNAEADAVRAALGEGFVLCTPSGHTRIATESTPAHTIDHVAVLGGSVASAEVLDAEGLSDHHPVRASVIDGVR